MTRKPLNREKLGIGAALDSRRAEPEEEKEPVVNLNVKAPEAHRRHWKSEAAKKRGDPF